MANRGLEIVKVSDSSGKTAVIMVNSPKRKMVTMIAASGKKTVKLFESFEDMDEFVDAKMAKEES